MALVKLPTALSGGVRVFVPRVNVWLGLGGVVLSYAGMFAGSWIMLSIGIGTVSVMPVGVAYQWLYQHRFEKKIAHWPEFVQVMPNEDGERVAFIRARDGTVSTLVLPDDYDPDDDNGRWFLEQVAPDLIEEDDE